MTREIDILLRYVAAGNEEERMKAIKDAREILRGTGGTAAEMPLKRRIETVLLRIGIPPALSGFRYIVYALELCHENEDCLTAITKELYPKVAAKFGKTTAQTERTIRHAIEVAWDRGDLEMLELFFGNTISASKGKPTNGEFLARLAMEFR